MAEPRFHLPDDTTRTFVCGMTGSGKTQAGLWQLSQRRFEKMPWLIFDSKGESMLQEIDELKEIGLEDKPPKKPGVYVVHYIPSEEDDKLIEAMLMRIHAQENIGVYIDEGYSIKDSRGLRAILTQGRSKHIPVIALAQRPAWVSNFYFSEANAFQVFSLNMHDDRRRVAGFVRDFDPKAPPYPRFHSLWYDVDRQEVMMLRPVPDRDTILQTFSDRLRPKTRYL